MHHRYREGLVFCGRRFSAAQLDEISKTVTCFPRLSRTEIVATICEHMNWYSPTGKYKLTACQRLLEKMEHEGLLQLPRKVIQKRTRKRTRKRSCISPQSTGFAPATFQGTLGELKPLELELVQQAPALTIFKDFLAHYHYLGYKRPFGCFLRYLVQSRVGPVGCLQFCGASLALTIRDQWIGWTGRQRLQNLGWVINNNRFLIFPSVKVRYLASHVLGLVTRRVAPDWQAVWGYRPVLMETYVDPALFQGTCYRAAGWQELGMTRGRGLARPGKTYSTTAKKLFVKALQHDFRQVLCSDQLIGRIDDEQ